MAEKTATYIAAPTKVPEIRRDLELSYSPTDGERRLKSSFIVALSENPVADAEHITAALVEQLTGDPSIHKLWAKPGFKLWFTAVNENRAKAEYTFGRLLDSFEMIALSDDPKSFGPKVQAARVLADILGYSAKSKPAKASDDELPSDPEELRAYIDKLEAKPRKAN